VPGEYRGKTVGTIIKDISKPVMTQVKFAELAQINYSTFNKRRADASGFQIKEILHISEALNKVIDSKEHLLTKKKPHKPVTPEVVFAAILNEVKRNEKRISKPPLP
jgi:hypothetical protein